MSQHVSCTPLTPEQRISYAAKLRLLATPEAQAGTRDPIVAAALVAELADKYARPE